MSIHGENSFNTNDYYYYWCRSEKEKGLQDSEAEELVDRIYSAKESLVKFGRQVFRLSSDFEQLSRQYPDAFKHLDGQHRLFANKEIIHPQTEEFYKATINYIELLRELNRRAIELSGTPRPNSNV